jgi:predicted DNA-binding WGR domain protein
MQITLRNHNQGRYYKLILGKDLLNDWLVTRVWGGLNSRLGNLKHDSFVCLGKALKHNKKLCRNKAMRGYELIK